jgi:hypothetical protein
MLLYIDEEFIQKFESRLKEINSIDHPIESEVSNRLSQIFKKYAEVQLFTDLKFEEFSNFYLLRLAVSINPCIRSKEDFFSFITKSSDQTPILAFTGSDESIIAIAEKNHGLSFTISNYVERLVAILEKESSIRFAELQNKFNWKDLKQFLGWRTKSMVLVDNYILKDQRKINSNLKPLLQTIISNVEVKEFKILVNKDEYKQNRSADVSINFLSIESNINDYIEDLDGQFSVKIKSYSKSNSKYDLHDRRLYMRYAIIEIGQGFDLLPIDPSRFYDRKIEIRTVFTKDTHDDFRYLYKGIENLLR